MHTADYETDTSSVMSSQVRSEEPMIAIDQYGTKYPVDPTRPRASLLEHLGRKHADKMYVDRKDKAPVHIGYVIAGLWLTIYARWENRHEPDRKHYVMLAEALHDERPRASIPARLRSTSVIVLTQSLESGSRQSGV